MEVAKLDHQIRETQIQQKVLSEEASLLLHEKLPFQANTNEHHNSELEQQS